MGQVGTLKVDNFVKQTDPPTDVRDSANDNVFLTTLSPFLRKEDINAVIFICRLYEKEADLFLPHGEKLEMAKKKFDKLIADPGEKVNSQFMSFSLAVCAINLNDF